MTVTNIHSVQLFKFPRSLLVILRYRLRGQHCLWDRLQEIQIYIYIYIYIKKQLMVASGQQRMPLRQEDQRFTVQASLHGIKTR